MQLTTVVACLSALTPIVSAFEFTKPNGSEPVDVTKPIEVAWEHEDDQARQMGWLEISFSCGGGTWHINRGNASRINSRDVSSWTWYGAPAFFADLDSVNQTMQTDDCQITGEIRDAQATNSSGTGLFQRVQSEKFDLEGYDNMVSAGRMTTAGLAFALAAAVGVAAVVL